MAKHLRDHWYIAVALIAIFLAGNGSGYVFGSKWSRGPAAPPQLAADDWAAGTLEKLAASLQLSDEQIDAVRPDVLATAEKVISARERTLFDYHVLLLSLHDQLEPKLSPEQRAQWQQSRAALEDTLKSRFSALLGHSNS